MVHFLRPSLIDLIGHVAYAALFAGQYAIAHGHHEGWALRLAGEVTWVLIGVKLRLTSVWMWGAVFAALDLWATLNRTVS